MRCLCLLLGLLGQENGLDVGENTTLGNGDTSEQFVQLLVVPDGQLEMSGDDTGLLVIPSGVSGQLQDFSSQIFEDCGQIDGGTGSHSLGIVSFSEQPVDTTDGELESGSG